MNARASTSKAVKSILRMTLLAIAVAVLFVGVDLIARHMPGAVPEGAGGIGGAGFELGGYLILMLVNVGLGTVVAWMLFGTRE
jgi:hypothetical protein